MINEQKLRSLFRGGHELRLNTCNPPPVRAGFDYTIIWLPRSITINDVEFLLSLKNGAVASHGQNRCFDEILAQSCVNYWSCSGPVYAQNLCRLLAVVILEDLMTHCG